MHFDIWGCEDLGYIWIWTFGGKILVFEHLFYASTSFENTLTSVLSCLWVVS